jgi:hypothetical protein
MEVTSTIQPPRESLKDTDAADDMNNSNSFGSEVETHKHDLPAFKLQNYKGKTQEEVGLENMELEYAEPKAARSVCEVIVPAADLSHSQKASKGIKI